jgi:hypothetical protein
MIVTFGFEDNNLNPPDVVANAVFNAIDQIGQFLPASFSNQWSWGPVSVTVMRSLGPQEGTGGTVVQGTNAGIATPPQNCALLVQKRTERGGRAGRGRMFWPLFQISETSVSPAGVVGSVEVTGWQDAMDDLLVNLNAVSQPMHLLHSAPPVGPPLPPDPVTALIVQTTIATQRNRLRR